MQRLLLPAMMILAVLGGPAARLAAAPASVDGPVLVIALDPHGAIARAGGSPVSPVGAPLGALAASADAGFVERLKDNGAWLVLDGRALAAICGVAT